MECKCDINNTASLMKTMKGSSKLESLLHHHTQPLLKSIILKLQPSGLPHSAINTSNVSLIRMFLHRC